MDIKRILINKNRGWRGLVELKTYDFETEKTRSMVFSFSPDVWDDMLKGFIVMQDLNNYYLIEFNNTELLPKGQRSVLIKNFEADVQNLWIYPKQGWIEKTLSLDNKHYFYILHFIKNKNNHTTSDWNCIGIRVRPNV